MGLIRLWKYSNKMLYPVGMLFLDVFVILSLLVMKEFIKAISFVHPFFTAWLLAITKLFNIIPYYIQKGNFLNGPKIRDSNGNTITLLNLEGSFHGIKTPKKRDWNLIILVLGLTLIDTISSVSLSIIFAQDFQFFVVLEKGILILYTAI